MDYDDLVVFDIAEKQPDTKKLIAVDSPINMAFTDTSFVSNDVDGSKVYEVNTDVINPPLEIKLNYDPLTMKDAKWIKVSGDFYALDWAEIWTCQSFIYTVERGSDFIKRTAVRINNKIGRSGKDMEHTPLFYWHVNEWGKMYFYSKIPNRIQRGDVIRIKIANTGKNRMKMKNISAQLFKET